MSSDPEEDPYENTIFQTLSSGEIGDTLAVTGGEATLAAGDLADAGTEATIPASEELDATAPVTADGDLPVSAPRATGTTETIVPHGDGSGALGLAPGEKAVPLERNRKIGNYRLDSQVGKGGQGEVWLGENTLAKKPVALKFLHPKLARDEQAMSDLRGEAGVLFDLTNDRIVRLMNIEQAGGHAFLVMEFLGGPSVQDVFKLRREQHKSGLEVEECLFVLDEIAGALDYANAEGVTHRDIKPANMMLTAPVDEEQPLHEADARVKLCDFGIAFTANKSMARSGNFDPIGTLPFMAPEVLMKAEPTPAADIYGLGATLYYLVKGEPPIYGRGAPRKLIERIKNEVPPPLGSGDAAFDAAIAKALSKDPAQRQETADLLLQEASGGRMGRVAQKKAKTLQWVVATVIVMALASAGIITWQLALQDTQAGDYNVANGQVTSDDVLDFSFALDNVDVETVSVGFRGGTIETVGRSEGRFQAFLPTPDVDGEAAIVIHEVGNPDKSFGGREVVIDKTIVASADDVMELGTGPYEVGEGVDLRFTFDEPVTLYRMEAGERVALALDRSGTQHEGHLAFVDARASHVGSTASAAHKMRFVAVDDAGNEAPFEFDVQVYDRKGLVAHYEQSFPLRDADSEWKRWMLGDNEQKLRAWESGVNTDDRVASAREQLLSGERGRLSARLQALLDSMDEVTYSLGGGSNSEEIADGIRIYTKEQVVTLRGTIHAFRSLSATLTETVGELVQTTPLDLDEETGAFFHPVRLDPGGRRVFQLDGGGLPRAVVVQLVHDGTLPVIVGEVDAPERHREETVAVSVAIDEDQELDLVWIEDEAGEELASMVQREGRWVVDDLPLHEGTNRPKVVALDKAHNRVDKTFEVELDNEGPALESSDVADSFVTGRLFEGSFDFSEPVNFAEVSFSYRDAATGAVTPIGSPLRLAPAATRVPLKHAIPDRESDQLLMSLRAEDDLGNESSFDWQFSLTYERWGWVPAGIQLEAEPVFDPEWARNLEGWSNYVIDNGKRYPRCIRHRDTAIEFVYVPSGEFELGSRSSLNESARQVHQVQMSGYYIGRTEVSRGQFQLGVDGTVDSSDRSRLPQTGTFENVVSWLADFPFDLPTEAQWEYAASGPENRDFPWGGRFRRDLVHGKPSEAMGSRAPKAIDVDAFIEGRSWCGAVQMAGNVYELCRDELDFANVGRVDPKGRIGGAPTDPRISRGGSRTVFDSGKFRTDFRFDSAQSPYSGFRVVWELPKEE